MFELGAVACYLRVRLRVCSGMPTDKLMQTDEFNYNLNGKTKFNLFSCHMHATFVTCHINAAIEAQDQPANPGISQ